MYDQFRPADFFLMKDQISFNEVILVELFSLVVLLIPLIRALRGMGVRVIPRNLTFIMGFFVIAIQ